MKRILMLICVFVFLSIFSISAIASEKESKAGILPGWMERVSLSGTIEGDYSWSEHNDVTDKGSDSTSDLESELFNTDPDAGGISRAGKEYKESVLSVTAAYEFVLRKREIIGGALFAERKAHVVSEPLEIAVRYEHFDDDGMADKPGIWAVDNRYSAGAGYSFYYDEESELTAYIAAEYRLTKYRGTTDSIDKNNEFLARLGLSF